MAGLRRILVVDDDVEIRLAMIDLLRAEGYVVEAAAHGEEALVRLRAQVHDRWLVLLDLMMPVMDGLTFLSLKEHHPVLAKIPVVVMTASGRCDEVMRHHHVRACLTKPLELERLLATIAACE